ncbi:MAG TPA: hypothetical protein VL025_03965 [Thermoanaerobaculia bacterium]|nr:hypothetical protein [Thermoanaerobaculia bacterium]
MAGLQDAAGLLWRRFFPPRMELPEDVRQLLAAIFPTLDLRRVSFHRGIPFHLDLITASQGMVLPAPLAPRGGRIYLHPRVWNPDTVPGLGLVVHEAYHALQLQEAGPGVGLVRPLIVVYLACMAGAGFRYHRHPLERDAYEVAGWSRSRFERLLDEQEEGTDRLAAVASLVVPTSRLRFWQRLAWSTPGFRTFGGAARILAGSVPVLGPLAALLPGALAGILVLLWLLFWTVAVTVLALLRGLVEGVVALTAGLLWGAGALGKLLTKNHR